MGDRTKRPMTEEERNLIVSLRNEGKTYPELAKLTKRPLGTISAVLSEAIVTGKVARRREMEPNLKRKAL